MCIYAHRRQHRIQAGYGSWEERGQLEEKRMRGKDRKKRERRSDARQSGAGMYYFARGVPHFYCYNLDLTSRSIKVMLLPAYRRFASVDRKRPSSRSPSLSKLQFVPNIRQNIAEIKARCEGTVNLMIARRLYFIYMYI